MQYIIVSAIVPYDNRKDTTTIGVNLLMEKVNKELKNGWKVYGSLVVMTDVRCKDLSYADNFGMHGIGFFQTMVK